VPHLRDLDDPRSEVAQIVQRDAFLVRKPEKGTGPKAFYLGAEESAIRPEDAARPFYYKEGQVRLRPIGAPAENPDASGDPRVDYDVPHERSWGADMVLYQFLKAVSAGTLLHCWHQRVTLETAGVDDRYGDIEVNTEKAHQAYKEWMQRTRPAPGPGGLRRPIWFDRPLRPVAAAYHLDHSLTLPEGQ
jgi:hypothetical protein